MKTHPRASIQAHIFGAILHVIIRNHPQKGKTDRRFNETERVIDSGKTIKTR